MQRVFLLLTLCFMGVVRAQDTCMVRDNLLGEYDPPAGESRVGVAVNDPKAYSLVSAGGFTVVLKIKKQALLYEHLFQGIWDGGDYHFWVGTVNNNPHFKLEARDSNSKWCILAEFGDLVLDQVHELIVYLMPASNSIRLVVDGKSFEKACPSDFVWVDRDMLGACLGGRWNSGTSPFTCDSAAYGSTLGAYWYDGLLRDDQAKQVLDNIVEDAADACGTCTQEQSALESIPTNHLVVSLDDHEFKTNSGGSSIVNFGEKTWNIFTNGGFTFVTKLKIDSSVSFGYVQPRIFAAHNDGGDNQDRIVFQLQGTASLPTIYYRFQQGISSCGYYNILVSTDRFVNLVWRYKVGEDRPTLEIDGVLAGGTLDGGCGANFLTSDRTLKYNKLNQNEFSGSDEENFAGEIAGFYGFDRWLDDAEAQTVLDSIVVHAEDTVHKCACNANYYPSPRVYPPPTTTSGFRMGGSSSKTYDVALTGSPYANGQYKIEYSSCYQNGNSYCPHNAFVHDNNYPWYDATWNGSPYTGPDNTYAGTGESLNGVDGQWIKIQLPEKIVFTGITTVATLYNANHNGRMPKTFKVFARNDDQGDWVEVYHQASTATPTFSAHAGIDNLAVAWQIEPSSATAYNTFALVVMSLINPGASTSLVVSDILLYGYALEHECSPCPYGLVSPEGATSAAACGDTCGENQYLREESVSAGLQSQFFTQSALANQAGGADLTASATYNAYDFDSESRFLDVSGDSRLDASVGDIYAAGQNDITVSFWVAGAQYDTNRHILRVHPTKLIIRTQTWNSKRVLFYFFRDAANNFCESFVEMELETVDFQLVTVVKSGTSVTVYLNGTPLSASAYNAQSTSCSGGLAAGTHATLLSLDNQGFFRGKLRDLRVYNRAIAPEEVTELYDLAAPECASCPAGTALPANATRSSQCVCESDSFLGAYDIFPIPSAYITPAISSTFITQGDIPSSDDKFTVFKYNPADTSGQSSYEVEFSGYYETDILLVGGGGGGSEDHGGGGGGGAVVFLKDVVMSGVYTITVGNGGAAEDLDNNAGRGLPGFQSSIIQNGVGVIAEGGGGGGYDQSNGNGGNGGSGGGGDGYRASYTYTGTAGSANSNIPALHGVTGNKYGNDGADAVINGAGAGGGGGGAGTAGSEATDVRQAGNDGGDGIASAIGYDLKSHFGITDPTIGDHISGKVYFGGGGGGGCWALSGQTLNSYGGKGGGGDSGGGSGGAVGTPGSMNTGGGGGGGSDYGKAGGKGGSGIVIIRYRTRSVCKSCPAGASSPAGSTSADSCVCAANSYKQTTIQAQWPAVSFTAHADDFASGGNMDNYAFSLWNGVAAKLVSGWTHTGWYAHGFLRSGAGDSVVEVSGLLPGHEYLYATYNFHDPAQGQSWGLNSFTLHVNGAQVAELSGQATNIMPTYVGKVLADADGKILFKFTHTNEHLHLSGLTVEAVCQGCPAEATSPAGSTSVSNCTSTCASGTYLFTIPEIEWQFRGGDSWGSLQQHEFVQAGVALGYQSRYLTKEEMTAWMSANGNSLPSTYQLWAWVSPGQSKTYGLWGIWTSKFHDWAGFEHDGTFAGSNDMPEGYFFRKNQPGTLCQTCSTGQVTANDGAISVDACICAANSYATADEDMLTYTDSNFYVSSNQGLDQNTVYHETTQNGFALEFHHWDEKTPWANGFVLFSYDGVYNTKTHNLAEVRIKSLVPGAEYKINLFHYIQNGWQNVGHHQGEFMFSVNGGSLQRFDTVEMPSSGVPPPTTALTVAAKDDGTISLLFTRDMQIDAGGRFTSDCAVFNPPLRNCNAAGRHLVLSGLSIAPVCASCPAGATSPTGSTSADSCVLDCGVNEYRNGGQCTSCPAGTTSPAGSTSIAACKCQTGAYASAYKYESLTAWYKFETDARDYGPYNMHLQPRLGATPSFNAEGYITASNDISFLLPNPRKVIPTGTTAFTVSFWVKNWNFGYIMRFRPSNLHFYEYTDTSKKIEISIEGMTGRHLLAKTTVWTLLVAVFTTESTLLYQDGVQVFSDTTNKLPSAGFEIEDGEYAAIFTDPGGTNTNSHQFQGDLKDLRFYNTAFTPSEVNELYTGQAGCAPCGGGLTTLAVGAESVDQCVCKMGLFDAAIPPAILTMDDRTMTSSDTTAYDHCGIVHASACQLVRDVLFPFSTTGVSIVLKIRFTSSAINYERVFAFSQKVFPQTGATGDHYTNFDFAIFRLGTSNTLQFNTYTPGDTSCQFAPHPYQFAANEDLTLSIRYDPASTTMKMSINGVEDVKSACTFPSMTIKQHVFGGSETFVDHSNVKLAGFAAFGQYLSDAQAAAVADSLVFDKANAVVKCTSCAAGLTTLAPGAESVDACACQTGSFKAPITLPGLNALYLFDSNTRDSSGNGYDLTMTNGATDPYSFLGANGVDPSLKIKDESTLLTRTATVASQNLLNNIVNGKPVGTLAVWVKDIRFVDGNDHQYGILGLNWADGKWFRLDVYASGKLVFVLYAGAWGTTSMYPQCQNSPDWTRGGWWHIVFTSDGTNVGMQYRSAADASYTSCTLLSEQSGNPVISTWTATGSVSASSIETFKINAVNVLNPGTLLDEVRVYNRVLSSEEILQVFDEKNNVCKSCGAGLTTLAPGADSSDACACQAGSYSPFSDAVVAFNPPLNGHSEVFDGSNTYSLGTRQFDISANGFTAVTKAKFDSTTNAGSRIFDFGNGSAQQNIILWQSGTDRTLRFGIFEGESICYLEASNSFNFGVFMNVIARFHPSTKSLHLHIDNVPYSISCTETFTDRTLLTNYIGKSHWSTDDDLVGKIAGLYTFNRFLSDAEAEAVLATIQTGALDNPLHTACMGCPAGLTTLAPGAESKSACVCELGSHQVGDLVSFFPLDGTLVDDLSSATMASSSTAYHTDATHGPVLNGNGNVYTITSPALATVLDASAFTISFWIHFVSLSSNDHSNILTRWDNYDAPYSATGGFIIMTTHSKTLKLVASSQEYESPTTLQESRWYHVSVVKTSSSTIELYLDGVLDVRWDATTRAMLNPINDIGIGSYCYSSSASSTSATCTTETNNAMFYLMDLRFYSRALSASEAAVLATRADHQGDVCASCPSEKPYTDPSQGATAEGQCQTPADECAAVTPVVSANDLIDLAQACGGPCALTASSETVEPWGKVVDLLDGNPASHWHSLTSTNPESVTIDLGAVKYVDHVNLTPQPSYACRSDATVYVSSAPAAHTISAADAGTLCGSMNIQNSNDDAVRDISCQTHGRYINLLWEAGNCETDVNQLPYKTMMEAKVFGYAIPVDDVSSGLLAQYQFNDYGSEEGVLDSSGNGKTLTAYNAQYEDFAFKSTDQVDYFEVANDGYFSPQKFTISFWIKYNTGFTTLNTVASCRENPGFKGWMIYLDGGHKFRFWTGTASKWDDTAIDNALDGTWQHFAITLDGSSTTDNVEIFRNKVSLGKYSHGYARALVNNMRIGEGANEGSIGSGWYPLASGSYLDEFRLYDRVLTLSEIEAVYDYRLPVLSGDVTSSMVKYLRFPESSSPYTLTFSAATTGDVLVVSGSNYRYTTNIPVSGKFTVTVGADTSLVTDAAGAVVATSAGGTEYTMQKDYIFIKKNAWCDGGVTYTMVYSHNTNPQKDNGQAAIEQACFAACSAYASFNINPDTGACFCFDASSAECAWDTDSSYLHYDIVAGSFFNDITASNVKYFFPQVILRYNNIVCSTTDPASDNCTTIEEDPVSSAHDFTASAFLDKGPISDGTTDQYMLFKYDPAQDTSGQTTYDITFSDETECDILIVAGGGAGGHRISSSSNGGSGGGAGGLIFQQNVKLTGSVSISVGRGGVNTAQTERGEQGKHSSVGAITAIGGGGGGSRKHDGDGDANGIPSVAQGGDGGSGGGSCFVDKDGNYAYEGGKGTPGQGHDGGKTKAPGIGAGGGGAGGRGGGINGVENHDGGIGLYEKNSINFKTHFNIPSGIGHSSGGQLYFAGGGGGGEQGDAENQGAAGLGGGGDGGDSADGEDATDHTGGGGGGASNAATTYSGGNGGSGVVVIRYKMRSKITCEDPTDPTPPPCPLDGTYVAACGCPADYYQTANSGDTTCTPCPDSLIAPAQSTSPDHCTQPGKKVTFSLALSGAVSAAEFTPSLRGRIKAKIARNLRVSPKRVTIVSVQDARRRLLAVSLDVEVTAEDQDQAQTLTSETTSITSAVEEAASEENVTLTAELTSSTSEAVVTTCCFKTWGV